MKQRRITGVKVLNQSETPGLGANCTNAWFSERYIGKTAEQDLTVVKVETSSPAEVQAITAATITSAAITDGVNAARQDFAASYGQPLERRGIVRKEKGLFYELKKGIWQRILCLYKYWVPVLP